MNGASCYTVGKVIIPEILKGLQSKIFEIKELCFDVFTDYISNFNYILIKESESVIKNKDAIFSIALETIHIDNQSLRNKVSNFLGNFSVILNKVQMALLIEGLISSIKSSSDIVEKISFFTTLNSVAKNTANRHGEFIKQIFPLIFEVCNRHYLESNTENYDQNNDLVECGLNLLETYILKLTGLIKNETEKIAKSVLDLMEYDPNFVYTDDNQEYGDYANEYEGYEGYEAFVYGDDSSWKTRRAAVRVLQSFIKSRSEIPRPLYELIIQNLVFSLREHEENTKLDIITCLSSFLRNLVIEDESNITTSSSLDLGLIKQKSMTNSIIPIIIKNLIENINKDLKSKNQKIKGAMLQLLSSLALVAPTDLMISFGELKPQLESCLKENISALTFFVFLGRLLKTLKGCTEVVAYFDDILTWVITGIKHDYYKINIESLNVAFHLIRLLVETLSPDEYLPKLDILYKELLPKFKANDIDQELKLTLISTFGNLILFMGHNLPQKSLEDLFTVYLDKTKNENLRPLIFNWLIKIIKNNLLLKLDSALAQFNPLILDLLSKNVLHVQYQTLEFLATIINFCPKSVAGNENTIIEALLSSTAEDSLVPLTYDILNSIWTHFSISPEVNEKSLTETIKHLNQIKHCNSSLNSIYSFIEKSSCLVAKNKIANFLDDLLDFGSINTNKAKCIAILASTGGATSGLIKTCIGKLASNVDDVIKKNILLCLGETGLKSKENYSDLIQDLEKMLLISNEEIKIAIAVCVGKLGVSEPSAFIESIISNTKKETIAYYFLSIREFLNMIAEQRQINTTNTKDLFKILISCAKDEDEKLRILCGECLGLLSVHSEEILKECMKFLQDNDNVIRSTFYYSLKYIFNNKYNSLQGYLDSLLELLIKGLVDPDLHVKQNAFNSLINFCHNYGNLIRARYVDIMTIFKKDHIIDPNLIATVDIGGGMKIKNDKGLPIRKAIYSILKILFETIPEKINVTETLSISLYGLEDHDDIQALTHGVLLKIAHFGPEAFISVLDVLIDSFKKKIDSLKNVTTQGTKVDLKKLTDLCTNIKRLFNELKRVHEIEENPKFIDLTNEINGILV